MALALSTQDAQFTGNPAVEEACRRIPPLWPLQNFVAVNPFLGLSDMPFLEAAKLLDKVAHSSSLMDSEYYLSRIEDGSITAQAVSAALAECDKPLDKHEDPLCWLVGQLRQPSLGKRLLTVADSIDRRQGTVWAPFVVDEISKWCSSYFDLGQSSWQMPWKDLPLYDAWKRAAEIDVNPEVFGLRGFRQHVRGLPESSEELIHWALQLLGIPSEEAAEFLHRQLVSVFGWSAYAAYQDRQLAAGQQTIRQMLAIRLAYDTALSALDAKWRSQIYEASKARFTEAKYVAQLALEHSFRSNLAASLKRAPRPGMPVSRKQLQAVFCIDVRSEVYRRALEAQSSEIETLGFAGFFGMAVEFENTARCPVLLAPKHRVQALQQQGVRPRFGELATAWTDLRRSVSACFSAVELGGAWFGARMLLRQFLPSTKRRVTRSGDLHWQIPLAERVDLAAAVLKNMSLDPSRLAPVVLFCGHGSRTENNPFASSLDCGACGGHSGDINARFAAGLMNEPKVRQGLQERGIAIPDDTIFVAGLHVTTTDEVILFESEALLTVEQRADLAMWLQAASQRARLERSRKLIATDAAPEEIEVEIERRSIDWSEVRPEWGLAGNAALIAAPRSRTRHLDLGGRAFLHEYDFTADEDGSVLQLILTAPVVVASWINLQYYGSTVDNRLYGSGNKVLHNVVGAFGVWEGNGGDLRTGLPLQSLHDGRKWMHEPLRLQVVVEAPSERIDRILEANPDVRNLVENNWIHLLAIERDSIYQRADFATWQSL